MLTDTILEDDRWAEAGLSDLAEAAGQAVLTHLGLEPASFEIAVLGCDDARIAVLNADFRDKTSATNVLSWPSEDLAPDTPGEIPPRPDPGTPEDPHHLGDLALAYETCAREAADQGKSMQQHLSHLIVHGVLHLVGYDHIDDADAEVMERAEVEILGKLGVPDPY